MITRTITVLPNGVEQFDLGSSKCKVVLMAHPRISAQYPHKLVWLSREDTWSLEHSALLPQDGDSISFVAAGKLYFHGSNQNTGGAARVSLIISEV